MEPLVLEGPDWTRAPLDPVRGRSEEERRRSQKHRWSEGADKRTAGVRDEGGLGRLSEQMSSHHDVSRSGASPET